MSITIKESGGGMWWVHDSEQPHPEGFDEHPEGNCIGAIYADEHAPRFRAGGGVEDLSAIVMVEIAGILLRLHEDAKSEGR